MGLRKTGCPIAGGVNRFHQLVDTYRAAVKKNRGLAAVEINLDLMHTRMNRQRFADRLLAFVTMHSLNADNGELILAHVLGHENLRQDSSHTLRPQAARGNSERISRLGRIATVYCCLQRKQEAIGGGCLSRWRRGR